MKSNGGLTEARPFERSFETVLTGVRMRVPMMNIRTVAADGGLSWVFSIQRGPDSRDQIVRFI